MTLTTPQMFVIASVVNLVLGAVFTGLFVNMVRTRRRFTHVLHVSLDPDAKSAFLEYRKPEGEHQNELKLKTDPEQRVILQGRSGLHSNWGRLWITHARHGFNYSPKAGEDAREGDQYVAPTDAQSIHRDPKLHWLAIDNPAAYADAIARNESRDALDANAGEESWFAKNGGLIITFAFILLAMTLAGVGYLVFQLSKGAVS